ncbi:unnamed protein product, partial [Meganyctiphanes norvegica]
MTLYTLGQRQPGLHHASCHNTSYSTLCWRGKAFWPRSNFINVISRHQPNECYCMFSCLVHTETVSMLHQDEKFFLRLRANFQYRVTHKILSCESNINDNTVWQSDNWCMLCPVCAKFLKSKIGGLKRQRIFIKIHGSERDYACDICGATYVTGTDLRRHRLKHDDVKPYPCNLCDKQFTRSHDLKVHLRYHNKELRYSCSVCNKQFVESGNYKRHMRRHTGERPYNCIICLMTFSQIHHLKTHMRSNHSDTTGSTEEAVASMASSGLQRTANTTITVATVPVGSQNSAGSTAASYRNTRTATNHSIHRRSPIKTAATAVIHHTQEQGAQSSHQITYNSQVALLGQDNGSGNNNSSISLSCGSQMPPHTLGLPITATSTPQSHAAQIHNVANQQHNNFLHPYNSHIYNHIPHFQAPIFDMCQQQNHVTPHFSHPS